MQGKESRKKKGPLHEVRPGQDTNESVMVIYHAR